MSTKHSRSNYSNHKSYQMSMNVNGRIRNGSANEFKSNEVSAVQV